jgi:hypothetical protein
MSSLKQIEANRRNAQKSTGPTTLEGKLRSRCNAVRHGLTAETVIAVLEDSDDYEAFEAAVISDYDAESTVERELVLRLASVLWRLRRATGIETALFESVTRDSRKHEHRLEREKLGGAADLPGSGTGVRRRGGKLAQLQCEDGHRGLLLAPGRFADLRARSPQPLRTHSVAASATDCVYAGVVAAPQASADPLKLSILVPATRTRLLVGRIQVTGCVSQGDSRAEVLANIREAIELYVEECRDAGDPEAA